MIRNELQGQLIQVLNNVIRNAGSSPLFAQTFFKWASLTGC